MHNWRKPLYPNMVVLMAGYNFSGEGTTETEEFIFI